MTGLPAPTNMPTESELIARYGITEVAVPYFHYGDFRYTNLKDALAQAERDREFPNFRR